MQHSSQKRRREQSLKITVQDQVIYGALTSLAKEIGNRLKRASYSSIIRESDDYGAAIISAKFEQLAEAETTPLQMGPMAGYCRGMINVLEEKGESLEHDTIYLHNDPYNGASHSPDIGAILPVFYDDELVAFIGNAAHHVDIGAAVPGTCIVEAHDTFSEGVRFRACPIERNGKIIKEMWNFIGDNVRVPKLVMGDIQAQIAACRWGKKGFVSLIKKFGMARIKKATDNLLNVSERKMREAIRNIPSGSYYAEGYIDGYENTDDVDIKICLKLEVINDEIKVDFSGSAAQLNHRPINMPFVGTTDMAVLLTLRSLLLPQNEHPLLPHNHGLFRPISICAPMGTIVNPKFPAPTIGRFCAGQVVSNLVVRALSDVLPDKVCAGCSSTKAITFSGVKNGSPWVYMDITEGAYGGMKGMHGLDAVDILYANTKNNPIEDIEIHYPLRVERYELRRGREGKGQWNGGRGPIRETRMLEDGYISVEGDGFRHAPLGINGGENGAKGEVNIIIDENSGKTLRLSSKINNMPIKKGSILQDVCPCGGGYGKIKL